MYFVRKQFEKQLSMSKTSFAVHNKYVFKAGIKNAIIYISKNFPQTVVTKSFVGGNQNVVLQENDRVVQKNFAFF